MKHGWQNVLLRELPEEHVSFDLPSREKYSRDFFHFSPILSRELGSEMADCIVRPTHEAEMDALLAIAVEYRVPVTVRGGGTGNYGQAVPLAGGIVLDLSGLNQLLDITGDTMTAQSGARMGRMEATLRGIGKELRIFPSTFQAATIGGFVSGGSGGIGSIQWGTVWDGLVEGMAIRTMEEHPRTIRVEGADVIPYIHNYGVAGIVTELSIAVSTRHEWTQWGIQFDSLEQTMEFGLALADSEGINKRLISLHEDRIVPYFKALKLPTGRPVALVEVDERHGGAFLALVEKYHGTVGLRIPAADYHKGTGVSDFSWNHTTLWAKKTDPQLTYLQVRFSPAYWREQIASIQEEFPDFMVHCELMRAQGNVTISGLPLLRYTTDDELYRLIRLCESLGVSVANPHTWRLEFGGRSPELVRLGELKRQNDPFSLLNPLKLEHSLGVDQHARLPRTSSTHAN